MLLLHFVRLDDFFSARIGKRAAFARRRAALAGFLLGQIAHAHELVDAVGDDLFGDTQLQRQPRTRYQPVALDNVQQFL